MREIGITGRCYLTHNLIKTVLLITYGKCNIIMYVDYKSCNIDNLNITPKLRLACTESQDTIHLPTTTNYVCSLLYVLHYTMVIKAAVVAFATALAIIVLPVPGGPYMRTPLL